jgi:hypothetical protein
MLSDPAFYDRALRRIYMLILSLGFAGGLAIAGLRGWQWGLGFLVGAAISFLNFRWLHQLVGTLGPEGTRLRKRLVIFLGLRYLVLGIGGYAIVLAFGLDLTGALLGLLVPVGAVLSEILFELAHGV